MNQTSLSSLAASENAPLDVKQGRAIAVVSLQAIKPEGQGMMMFAVKNGLDLVGVEADEGAEIVQVIAGTTTLAIAPKESWTEVFAKQDSKIRLIAGMYITLVAKNISSEEKVLTATIYVDNEAAKPKPSNASPAAVSSQDSKPQGTLSSPRRVVIGRPSSDNSPTQSGNRKVSVASDNASRRVSAEQSRAYKKRETPPAPTGVIARVVQRAPTQMVDAPRSRSASVRHERLVSSGLDMTLPGEGERTVLFLKGHVSSLIQSIEEKRALHANARPSVVAQLNAALRREGAAGVTGDLEVAVILKEESIHQLLSFAKSHHPQNDVDFSLVIESLKNSITNHSPNPNQAAMVLHASI